MNRRDFLKKIALTIPALSLLPFVGKEDDIIELEPVIEETESFAIGGVVPDDFDFAKDWNGGEVVISGHGAHSMPYYDIIAIGPHSAIVTYNDGLTYQSIVTFGSTVLAE